VLVGGLELLLQTGAWWVRATGREIPLARMTDEFRVLCLGDSNTYGVYLVPEDSFPSQLEATWNETVDTPKLRVFNLGYPGVDSSQLRFDLVRMLDSFRPHVVVLMVGANDYWTVPRAFDEAPGSATILERIERGSRLYRLVYMLANAYRSEELESPRFPIGRSDGSETENRGEFVFGDEIFELKWVREKKTTRKQQRSAQLRENLRAIVEQARERATPIVLMTYPTQQQRGFYRRASQVIAKTARELDAPLVDLRREFAQQCPDLACEELLFPDRHPKRPGYRIVADAVARELEKLVD
jgi:lysophospholipase L1-like esterase